MRLPIALALAPFAGACGGSAANVPFRVGEAVECRPNGGEQPFAGEVTAITDDQVRVRFVDGREATERPAWCERQPADGRGVVGRGDPAAAKRFSAGQRVTCHRQGGSNALPASIVDIQNGRLWVDYDDGRKDALPPSLCTK